MIIRLFPRIEEGILSKCIGSLQALCIRDNKTSIRSLCGSRGEWRPSRPPHIPPTLKELKTKSKANPGNREIRKSRENPKICNIIYFFKNRKQIPNMAPPNIVGHMKIALFTHRFHCLLMGFFKSTSFEHTHSH